MVSSCGGDGGNEETGPARSAKPVPVAPPQPGGGRRSTNAQEAAGLVREVVRARPVRCAVERLRPGELGLYRCRAGSREYRVEWDHYGTGAYTISELPDGRVVARGTLSIVE